MMSETCVSKSHLGVIGTSWDIKGNCEIIGIHVLLCMSKGCMCQLHMSKGVTW